MKTIILYYTFGGATMREAERRAAELGADCLRFVETRPRSFVQAFIPGGLDARHRKATAITPADSVMPDLSAYNRVVVGAPIWANYPAPAFNAIIDLLPAGQEVALFFCSGGGAVPPSQPQTLSLLANRGLTVISYENIRTERLPGKMK